MLFVFYYLVYYPVRYAETFENKTPLCLCMNATSPLLQAFVVFYQAPNEVGTAIVMVIVWQSTHSLRP